MPTLGRARSWATCHGSGSVAAASVWLPRPEWSGAVAAATRRSPHRGPRGSGRAWARVSVAEASGWVPASPPALALAQVSASRPASGWASRSASGCSSASASSSAAASAWPWAEPSASRSAARTGSRSESATRSLRPSARDPVSARGSDRETWRPAPRRRSAGRAYPSTRGRAPRSVTRGRNLRPRWPPDRRRRELPRARPTSANVRPPRSSRSTDGPADRGGRRVNGRRPCPPRRDVWAPRPPGRRMPLGARRRRHPRAPGGPVPRAPRPVSSSGGATTAAAGTPPSTHRRGRRRRRRILAGGRGRRPRAPRSDAAPRRRPLRRPPR